MIWQMTFYVLLKYTNSLHYKHMNVHILIHLN